MHSELQNVVKSQASSSTQKKKKKMHNPKHSHAHVNLPFKHTLFLAHIHTHLAHNVKVFQVSSLVLCVGWVAVSVEVLSGTGDGGAAHTLRGSMPGGDTALDVAMEVKVLGSSPLTVVLSKYVVCRVCENLVALPLMSVPPSLE